MFEVLYGLSAVLLVLIIYSINLYRDNVVWKFRHNRLDGLTDDYCKRIDELEEKLDEKIAEMKKSTAGFQQKISSLNEKLKEQTPDDATQQSIHELTSDLKTHGFMLMRVNPDHVFLRQ